MNSENYEYELEKRAWLDWKPEDVFEEEEAEKYKKLHKDIWERLIRLHATINILEHIVKFPFSYVVGPMQMAFWNILYWNFRDMAVVLIHGLVNDSGTDTCTLAWFKNHLSRIDWADDKRERSYHERLKKVKFSREIRTLCERVRELRNKFVAHMLRDTETGLPFENLEGMSIAKLRELFEGIEKLFDACSFGGIYETRLLDFIDEKTVGGEPAKSHIEYLLDLIVKDSYFFKEPEEQAEYWPGIRKSRSKEHLEILNSYRKKFGMPEV